MMSRIDKVALLVVAALSLAQCVLGQPPQSGTYSNSFGGVLSVWDISGSYTNQDILGGSFTGDYTISQDAKGKITGAGFASVSCASCNRPGAQGKITGAGPKSLENGPYSDISLNLDFTVNGSVKDANGVTKVQWNEKFKGSGTVRDPDTGDIVPLTFNGLIRLNLSIDETNRTLSGRLMGDVCASAQGLYACASLDELNGGPIEVDMPIFDSEQMDGTWNMAMDVQNVNGKSLVSTATITLSNGRSLTLAGKGCYQAKSDLSRLSLKGDSLTSSKGASLDLTVQGATLNIVSMVGKLLGQKPTFNP
jgi:hypothetical protein